MDKNNILTILTQSVKDSDLKPSELPALDLYIDQITTLLNEKLGEQSGRTLTKTMVNNYSKEGIISPIKGKKYSTNHITQMILISQLKQSLSINEIKQALAMLPADTKDAMLCDLVEEFLNAKNYQREVMPSFAEVMLEETGCDLSTSEGQFKAVLSLCSASQYLKCMALDIIANTNNTETD